MTDAPAIEQDPEIVKPEEKAELVQLCIDGILALLKSKDRFVNEEDGLTYAYRVWDAAGDLIQADRTLFARLCHVWDPEVEYAYTRDAANNLVAGENPTKHPARIKTAIAVDVACHYAMDSREVRLMETERDKLAADINP